MKWVLLWIAGTTGSLGPHGLTSGSAQFDSQQACLEGKKTLETTLFELESVQKDYGKRTIKANCISSQGEKQKG